VSEPEQPKPTSGEQRSVLSWAAFVSMGLTMAVCVAAGLLLGIWLDGVLHTAPLLLFVGLVVGCVVAGITLVSLVRRNL
jgi:F0F1-type ATP synthase assembly protein I